MASHDGDETKTISYMSKFLKYAPERAGGGGRKETESVVNCIYYCMQYMKKENIEMSFGVCCLR